jgi:histidyl-tRNA synthetase
MAKSIIKPRTLKGFRDFLPINMTRRENMIDNIREVYKSYGYLPIDTPALEYSEILLGKGGDETDKQMYRFEDQGGRDVAMRFDLTIPFARYTAEHFNELTFPFKRYHIGTVWRGESPQAGRYREFMQCDFDTIGTTSIISDVETVSVIYDSMKTLGINNFTIKINNRYIMNGLLKKIKAEDKQVDILRTVDKLAKIGRDNVSKLLADEVGLSKEQIDDILGFIQIKGSNQEVLSSLKEGFAGEPTLDNGIETLEKTVSYLSDSGIPEDNSRIDLSITRGLDYYTGIVMETYLDDLPGFGSVCSGGRYDNLAGLYTKQVLPGVGASIGVDRLLAALEELNLAETRSGIVDVLIINMDDKLASYYLKTARMLREAGIKVEIYPDSKKLGKQFAFADKKGFKLTLVVGGDEFNSGVVNLRVVSTGERLDNIMKEDLVKTIHEHL